MDVSNAGNSGGLGGGWPPGKRHRMKGSDRIGCPLLVYLRGVAKYMAARKKENHPSFHGHVEAYNEKQKRYRVSFKVPLDVSVRTPSGRTSGWFTEEQLFFIEDSNNSGL